MPTVTITWTDNGVPFSDDPNDTNETGFRVYRASGSSPSYPADYTQVGSVGTDVTTYDDTTAPNGETLTYTVVAYNDRGESGSTSTSTVTIPPTAPSNLTATAASDSQIELDWTDNSTTEDEFRVYRDGTQVATVGANTTTYSDTGLSADTTYNYEVTAYSTAGGESSGTTDSATTDQATQTISANAQTWSFDHPQASVTGDGAATTTANVQTWVWEHPDARLDAGTATISANAQTWAWDQPTASLIAPFIIEANAQTWSFDHPTATTAFAAADEWGFTTRYGTIATQRVDAEFSGTGEGGVERYDLLTRLTFDQAHTFETALSQLGGARIRDIPDGDNVAVDDSAGDAATLTIDAPDGQTAVADGEYVVLSWRSERLSEAFQQIELTVAQT